MSTHKTLFTLTLGLVLTVFYIELELKISDPKSSEGLDLANFLISVFFVFVVNDAILSILYVIVYVVGKES